MSAVSSGSENLKTRKNRKRNSKKFKEIIIMKSMAL
jgi:hypothetical protein